MNYLLKICLAIFLFTQIPAHTDNGYETDFIELVEIVYGKGYLSQGGSNMVENMFHGIELDGKRILDLGCGIGGPTRHLITNYNVNVTGVDPDPIMIERSQKALEHITNSKGFASYLLMENPLNLKQFPDNSFDIVTSKEAILHVPHEHKLSYYKEIFRVLKPKGQLIILDWLHSSPNYSEAVKKMMEMDGVPFNLNTPSEYQSIVNQAGFSNVVVEDITDSLAHQTREDLITIDNNKTLIVNRFGQEIFDYASESWAIQGRAFQDKELLVCLIKAIKDV